jgi:hypothetical protein
MSARGICPVCNGTCKVDAGEASYRTVVYGYDSETNTYPCKNCGGQYMYGSPKGEVRLREDGTPCTHKYVSKSVGRCLTEYFCIHCGDRFQIDSGD